MWGIEKFGRRPLLLYGAIVMCICEYLVAIIGVTISTHNKSGQQALIALVCIYIAAFASTWGPIAWVITGEIFPLNVRAKAISLSVASNWQVSHSCMSDLLLLTNVRVGYGTGPSRLRLRTWSTRVPVMPTSVSKSSLSGARHVSDACSSRTSAYPRPRDCRSSRSIFSTRTRPQSRVRAIAANSLRTTRTSPTSRDRAPVSYARMQMRSCRRSRCEGGIDFYESRCLVSLSWHATYAVMFDVLF